MSRLRAIPLDLAEANAFVAEHHRHHEPVVGHKFSIGAVMRLQIKNPVPDLAMEYRYEDKVVGVVIVGRPISRMRDDGETLEVTRLCSTGEKNVCSFLYGAAARAAFALGYKRIGTYILNSEPGTTLKAAGWRLIGEAGGGSWSRGNRPRVDTHPTQPKLLFEASNER